MHMLVRPLGPSRTIDYWQLSDLRQVRFDIPDETMGGDMDAGFFLASSKNYIPHEYPCRRMFAERWRGVRPEPAASFEPKSWWFPFGSDRVDRSGFWFRPTRVECWARTYLRAGSAGTAKLRLSTCGAAAVWVNGNEAGWIAGYRRNLEDSCDLAVPLQAGDNEVRVWFGDLCERDTRFTFSLGYLDGPDLTVALPVPVSPERAVALEALMEGVRFERPSVVGGPVSLLFSPPASELQADLAFEGHNIVSRPISVRERIPAGRGRLDVDAAKLPAEFRYVRLSLSDGALRLSRMLGIEICPTMDGDTAPVALEDRAGEALDHVARAGEWGTLRALALIATGQSGAESDRMIAADLPAILDCHDCADFLLVPLLWARLRWPERMGEEVRQELDTAILRFRYWLDEPGNDVMWFFSENHALLFHTACYLAGALFAQERFARSGRTGLEQQAIGGERVRRWFDHFDRWEMAEWNAAPYFPIDLKGLCALYALAPDADIRERARRAIARLAEIVALSAHQGVLTASQGRSYEHSLRPCRSAELSGVARLLWGRGWYGAEAHTLPQLALCIREHGLRLDERLRELALWSGESGLEWCFRQGEKGFAPLYHYKTRDYAMGSVAAYKPGGWGYQETVLHARLGDAPEAQFWINHPGELIPSGSARPSFWGGCGTLPRVHQYRDLAFLAFELQPGPVEFTHVWAPEAAFDEVAQRGDMLLLRAGRALACLRTNRPLEPVTAGPTAGCEYRLPGLDGCWLVRLSDVGRDVSLAAFGERMARLAWDSAPGEGIVLEDPDYGRVECALDGTVTAEGRRLDPSSWTIAGAARTIDGGEIALPSQSDRTPAR